MEESELFVMIVLAIMMNIYSTDIMGVGHYWFLVYRVIGTGLSVQGLGF